jgi:regulator of sirC expression with transglutaminase-like and TPR domain
MQLPEEHVPLDEAALLISAHANDELDLAAQLSRLDELAQRVPRADTSSLSQVLFHDLGLRGDRDRYDDPVNSYLDRVLDRRLGIPISLSILLIEIGRRRGVRLEAVGMPGHFLVRDPTDPEQLIDAFDQGRCLSYTDCERLMRAVTGTTVRLTPGMLAPTGTWATLSRMLANLDRSFEERHDHGSLEWVSRLRIAIPEASLGDRTNLAGRLAALGHLDSAAAVLETAAAGITRSEERDRLLHEASTLRARLN